MDQPELPKFNYHPDPIGSGSVIVSDTKCKVCKKVRGYVYTGPVYADDDYEDCICPWCIADGSAAKKLDATFVDSEAFSDELPDNVMEEVTERTPGYLGWQSEQWPCCCGDATVFREPAGIAELRGKYREWEYEFSVLNHIIYDMKISGGAATRLLDSLNLEKGPTAYLFKCQSCSKHHVHIDRP